MDSTPGRKGREAWSPAPGSDVPHGTHSAYKFHKCRCEVCVEFKRAVDRAYYEKNRERVKAKVAENKARDPELVRQRDRDYHARNRDVVLAKKREYARKNSARQVERVREWRKQPHAKLARRLDAHRRRDAKFDRESREFAAILLTQWCSYCGGPAETIDHIVPVSAGGTSHWSNLTPACKSCNCQKNDLPLISFLLRRLAERPPTPGRSVAA